MIKYSSKRNKDIDIIRGMGIILVVSGHIDLIRRFAYLFHVPLFFFASGYFFNKNQNFSEFVYKGIKRYYVPFVVAELIFMFFHNSLVNVIGYDAFTLQDIQVLIPKMLRFQNVCARLGQLWFLLALFSVSILYFLLSSIFNSQIKFTVLGAMVLLHFLLYSNTNIFEFEVCALFEVLLVMTTIYGIGNMYRKYEKYLKKFISFNGGCIALFLLLIFTKIPSTSYDVRLNYYGNTLMAFISMLVGIYFSLCVAKSLQKNVILSDFVAITGQYSLWILVGQSVLYKVVGIVLEGALDEIVIKLIQLSVAVLIPLGCAYLYECIKLVTNRTIFIITTKLKLVFKEYD